MDKYNSRLAKALARKNGVTDWAITLGQTTFYSRSKEYVSYFPKWIKHEDTHKRQWKEKGLFKFAFLYCKYMIKFGYENNPFEIDARRAENEN